MLALAACALELNFWEHATTTASEMSKPRLSRPHCACRPANPRSDGSRGSGRGAEIAFAFAL
jgi:hypothetical protein